jgi:hydantoinase/carbamoylase family amidase
VPDRRRIEDRLEQLWEVAQGPAGGADRPAYSAAEARAVALVAGWARELDLEPGVDEHGNLWALPPDWDGPLITSGSHLDTVPDGGRFDGALGTVLGLELAADLPAGTAGGARIALLVCAAEEAPRFGAGTIGSRLLTGTLSRTALHDLRDRDGITAAAAQGTYLRELREHAGLALIAPQLDRVRAHAEVHVATRRSLSSVAVVTTVAAVRRYEVVVRGDSGHAGEIAMADRHDALTAAAAMVLAIEAAARAAPAQTVATVGTLAVAPGAVSVIPRQARLGIDVRGIDADSVDRLERAIRSSVTEIAHERGVVSELSLIRESPPVAMDARMCASALASGGRLGVELSETWSGAGHDAQHLNAVAPALLMFVPLHGGESHTPQEGADPGEIMSAARVVADVVRAA